MMPARICKHPGCGRTTQGTYCDRHGIKDEGRPGVTERGYDGPWKRLRAKFLRHWLATRGPYCGACGCILRPGRETHVDHVIPFEGRDDPRRLQWENLQVLCCGCNAAKARG